MGNTSQSLTSQQTALEQYKFIKPLTESKNLYKHSQTQKQFISVQRTFPTPQAIAQYEKSTKKMLEIKHPYFLNETEHAMLATSMLCSMQYRVVHLFEYESHTLEQELKTRKQHERYFEEKEIWSILCSTVLCLAHLTKQDIPIYTIHPKDIAIDKLGMVKILSPLLTDSQSPQLLDPLLYYSPQYLKSLKSQTFSQLSNKSCVFTLGITLLHIMSLQPMNELYNYDNFTINLELLNQLVDKIAHQEIKEVIRKMVKQHGYDRITFTQLQEMLYDVLEGDEEGKREHQDGQQQDIEINSRLENSIHRLDNSRQYRQAKQSHNISYQTRSSSSRDHPHTSNNSTSHISITMNNSHHYTLKPLSTCPQDTPNLPCQQSSIDVEKVDQADLSQKNLQSERNNLPESHITDGTLPMGNSHFYQTLDNKTLRKALHQVNSFHNVTLGKTHPQNVMIPTSSKSSSTQHLQQDSNKPYHVRQQLKRGIYEGYKLNNMRHGYGVFYYVDGGKYAGEWSKNKMQGRGALYYANDQIAYEGEWLNDKLHGYGLLYNELPTYLGTEIDFRALHKVQNAWIKYEGNFVEDQKCGQGTLFLANGEYYRGGFSQDLPHGNGVFKCMNGTMVKGNWVLGMMQ